MRKNTKKHEENVKQLYQQFHFSQITFQLKMYTIGKYSRGTCISSYSTHCGSGGLFVLEMERPEI